MEESTELPQYRVRDRCFMEPELLKPGAEIEFEGPPGPHLIPLNEAARARMEAWLSEEVPERDENGKLMKTADGKQRMHTPHEAYRMSTTRTENTETPLRARVLKDPPKPQVGVENTLAGKHLQRKLGEMRPPPAPFSEAPPMGDIVLAHAAPKVRSR